MQLVLILKRHLSPPEYNRVKATTLLSQSVSCSPYSLFAACLTLFSPHCTFPMSSFHHPMYSDNVQCPHNCIWKVKIHWLSG